MVSCQLLPHSHTSVLIWRISFQEGISLVSVHSSLRYLYVGLAWMNERTNESKDRWINEFSVVFTLGKIKLSWTYARLNDKVSKFGKKKVFGLKDFADETIFRGKKYRTNKFSRGNKVFLTSLCDYWKRVYWIKYILFTVINAIRISLYNKRFLKKSKNEAFENILHLYTEKFQNQVLGFIKSNVANWHSPHNKNQ